MSLSVSDWVWKHSPHKGTDLLMMLAIADAANDDGMAYPGMAHLARKARISKTRAQAVVRKLKQAGAITVLINKGISTDSGQTNVYYVNGYRKSQQLTILSSTPTKSLTDEEKAELAAKIRVARGIESDTPQNAARGIGNNTPRGIESDTQTDSIHPIMIMMMDILLSTDMDFDHIADAALNETGEYVTDGEGEDRTADIDGKENTEETPTPAFTGEIELPNNRQAQLMRKLGIDESQIAKYHKLPHEKVQNICHIARVKGGAGAPGYAVVMFQDLEKYDQRAALLASTVPPAPPAPEQAPNNYAKKSANVLHFGTLLQKGDDRLPTSGAFAKTANALHNLSDSQLAGDDTQAPSDPARKAWDGVLLQLKHQLAAAQYATTVQQARYVSSDAHSYTIEVPHAYAQQQCIRIQRTIEAVLRTVVGEAYQIHFVIAHDEKVKA